MKNMPSAKVFPLRHVSIRVPWHDGGWNGTVCQFPGRNTACLKLKNIAENKDEQVEGAAAGKSVKDLEQEQYPACVTERATFLADFSFTRLHQHPYSKHNNGTHAHFRPTPLHYPAYSAAGVPFRWMMKKFVFGHAKESIRALKERFPLEDVSLDLEPSKDELGFETSWLQDYRNHRMLLECFWSHIQPQESLVFFYAKQVPLVEDTGRRVLIGAGRVQKIGSLKEYEYDGPPGDKLRSMLWECMVQHSVRPDFSDGFLMPYREAIVASDDGREFDPAEVVAFAPEDRFEEFSYATEHVGHDAAIAALLSFHAALLRAAALFNISIKPQQQWIDRELGRLWDKRGPFPGMGSVLSATGIQMGHFIANAIADKVGDQESPWPAWDAALVDPEKHLPKELAENLDATIAKSWKKMPKERRSFLELLSRMDISQDQAGILAAPEERLDFGIELSDADFMQNPYLFYDATRLTEVPVGIDTVDRAMFPAKVIRQRYPLPEPTRVKTGVDARRLRSLSIRELEQAAAQGDTLRTRDEIIASLRRGQDERKEQKTDVTADLLAVAEEELFSGEIRIVELADKRMAYQLERLGEAGELIRSAIEKRIRAPRHEFKIKWRQDLDRFLDEERQRKGIAQASDAAEVALENRARQEKAAALGELAASRFSVLIGSAGTGKTTLLSVLCRNAEISDGGILLLAPTGKARVRMEGIAREAGVENYEAFTLAQFLGKSDRYDFYTQRYLLTFEKPDKVARTVIVDECSMLTEEMMAALLDAISGVHRLIFVGDPRQLPPIGAGRPFVDIVARLTPDDVENRFPRVATGFAELTVTRRQGAGERDDLQLAAWFSGKATGPGEDQVFEILAGKRRSEHIRFVRWETPDDLERLLPDVLAESLRFGCKFESWQSFALSLGAQLDDRGSAWFNVQYGNRPSSGKQAEAWQILSPVRQKPWGVDTLNRWVHVRYKGPQIEQARNPGRYRSIPKPMGDAQIIYGDKVINNRNTSVFPRRIYPEPEERGYLANGEIGMAVGHRWTKKRSWKPECLEIEFSTQIGQVFKFYESDFSDEGDAGLELAYALTVHKAQGSEFGVVFLVLPRSPLMLTRELLYTALTRQKQHIVVLHQGSATELQNLSSERYSASATRLTNLFGPPEPVKVDKVFLERRLIHITARGDAVRSKSEVIIADHLHAQKIRYLYEAPLELGGVTKYPDFTFEDDDAGITYYWEHCGMLSDPAYLRRWEDKLRWYREHQILPYQDGGGKKGTLIVTEDTVLGGISSQEIVRVIRNVILRESD